MNLDLIKRASIQAIESENPCKILYGKVTSVNPLVVTVNQNLVLTKEFLILDSAVDAGEDVVLCRYQGGQRYLVLSTRVKYVDNTTNITTGGITETVTGNWKLLGRFKLTYYCCEKYPHICNAGAPYKTAMGTTPRVGVVAVDPKKIKLGSYLKINDQVYHAEDTGGAIKENRIDICVKTHKEAMAKGVSYANVYLKV